MANTIEFKLFAPYNKATSLIGSFSNWQEIPMEKDEQGYFKTQLKLTDGIYQYKFRVQSKSWFFVADQWVDIVDPYATDVDNLTQNSILRIRNGQPIVDTYVWQHDDKFLPPDHALVIYEMHIADFSGGENDANPRGKFKHALEKLNYLCDLGINAIELMPVQEYPGDYGWGYNPRHFFATETSYGSTEDLKHFIDECHARGIRVLIDGIYNHSESASPLTQIDHDYWYHHSARDPENNWGPEFNYEHYDEKLDIYPARKFIGDNVRFWVEEYHTDGIRYDAARQIGNYDFMHWIVKQTKLIAGSKPFYNVAEYIPENNSITGYDGPMDGCWHESFYHCIIEYLCGAPQGGSLGDRFDMEGVKEVLDCKRQGFMGVTNVVNYLTSHDHNHLMAEFANRGIFDDSAFKRAKLGATLMMTAVGIPMIWMGEEFGEYKSKTIEPSKIDWRLLENESNRSLFDYYKDLINLRKNNPAFYAANIDFFHEDLDTQVLAYCRWNEEGHRIVVIANFSGNFLAGYRVNHFPANGTWQEWKHDYEVQTNNNNIMIDLFEYEAKVFVWQF